MMNTLNGELTAAQVAAFLQAHPDFFNDYPQLLEEIAVPTNHDARTISLTERQVLTLRDKNKQLEQKMLELIAFGEANDSIGEKMHRLSVGLAAAETFQAVIYLLNFHLRDDFSVPHVALRLWHKPAGVGDLPEFAAVTTALQLFADSLARPYCGSTSGFGTESWFGEHADHIRSQALIALRNGGGTIGMVALGSEDIQRFYADMGTLYLERLGELVSAALGRVTRPRLVE